MNYNTLDRALDYLNNGIIDESLIVNEKDIYYNKEAFDNGDINLCFITGISGSGKSTMAKNLAKDNIEKYELDDVVWNKMSFTMDQFKEYGDLIYSFFKGPGKKYYYTEEDVKSGKVKSVGDDYEELLIHDFVDYSIRYAKSHKDKKFILEGVWVVDFFEPSYFKDYAFYIKGTSLLVSRWRAAKRDSKDAGNKKDEIKARVHNFFSYAHMKANYDFEKNLNKFRKYFKSRIKINEATKIIDCKKLYHLSQSNLNNKTIQPTIPNNFFTKNGYEDNVTKRVCFSTSIDYCLRALSSNLKGQEFYVHIPDDITRYNIFSPDTNEVPDAKVTHEKWICSAVKMKCIGKIKVIGDKGEDGLVFKYGNNSAELYDWDWIWIEKY